MKRFYNENKKKLKERKNSLINKLLKTQDES